MPRAESDCAAPLRHRGDHRAHPTEAAEDETHHQGAGRRADGEPTTGSGHVHQPEGDAGARPSARPPTLMSDMPRSLSPR